MRKMPARQSALPAAKARESFSFFVKKCAAMPVISGAVPQQNDVRGGAVRKRGVLAQKIERDAEQPRRGEPQLVMEIGRLHKARARRDENGVGERDAVEQYLPRLEIGQQVLRRDESDAPDKSDRRRQPVAEQPPASPILHNAAPSAEIQNIAVNYTARRAPLYWRKFCRQR